MYSAAKLVGKVPDPRPAGLCRTVCHVFLTGLQYWPGERDLFAAFQDNSDGISRTIQFTHLPA